FWEIVGPCSPLSAAWSIEERLGWWRLTRLVTGSTILGLRIPKQASAQHHGNPAIFWQVQKLREDGALP
ncbi:MAG: hypothetical protein WA728_27465, partial [Xanthobacteraceae bacterium]